MKKNNKNGFVLVETLIVVVFVAAIFSIIFLNFYPLIGEYERRENYDDVESKYGAYWVKKMIQESNWKDSESYYGFINGTLEYPKGVYVSIDNNSIENLPLNIENEEYYKKLFKKQNINAFIFTKYNLTDLKTLINNNMKENNKDYSSSYPSISEGFKDYIKYLPNYTHESLNGSKYRILIEFKHDSPSKSNFIGDEDITEYPYYTYATLEVTK